MRVRPSRRSVLTVTVLAVVSTVVVAGLLPRGSGAPTAEAHPTTTSAPTTSTSTTIPVIHRFTAGEALVPELVGFAAPDAAPDAEPVATASNPTREGFPLVVSVIDRSADGLWMLARFPVRPNGTTGWVRSSDLQTWDVPNRIEVNISLFRLRVYDGDSTNVLFETDVAVGVDRTPTPTGDFFIDIVNPLHGDRVYGWGQLSVAGFSDVLQRFGGGIGQIAIHGWNNDSVMGTAASNGCVRMRNDDIAAVADLAPLGTPVKIIP